MLDHMKQILVQLDEPLARRLEKYVPGSSRKRSEFIRDAIERALLTVMEIETEAAMARRPIELNEWGWSVEPYPIPPDIARKLDRIIRARDRASAKAATAKTVAEAKPVKRARRARAVRR